MKIKLFSILLAAMLLIGLVPGLAEDAGFNPPDEWWGMSKTSFTQTYRDEKFTELEVDGRKALLLEGLAFTDDVTVDVYFRFAEKEAGKSYYGISEIIYLVPLQSKRYSDADLKSLTKKLQAIIVGQNGKADASDSSETVWNEEGFTVTLAAKAYRKLNGSSNKTVGVTYTRVPGQTAPAEKPASASRSTKSGELIVTAQAVCNDYNHVGDNWATVLKVNGTKITGAKNMTFKVGDSITLSADISEEDSQPDKGSNSITHVITESDLKDGFKVKLSVEVKENGGRYNGYAAKWSVTFIFTK